MLVLLYEMALHVVIFHKSVFLICSCGSRNRTPRPSRTTGIPLVPSRRADLAPRVSHGPPSDPNLAPVPAQSPGSPTHGFNSVRK